MKNKVKYRFGFALLFATALCGMSIGATAFVGGVGATLDSVATAAVAGYGASAAATAADDDDGD